MYICVIRVASVSSMRNPSSKCQQKKKEEKKERRVCYTMDGYKAIIIQHISQHTMYAGGVKAESGANGGGRGVTIIVSYFNSTLGMDLH